MNMVYLVYGITDCPACLRAQALLMELEIEYVFIETDFSPSYRDSIKKEFDFHSFPILVRVTKEGETLIGGYDDLLEAVSGDLEDLTGSCSIIKNK